MRESIKNIVSRFAALVPAKDRGNAAGGDMRAVMILGDNTGEPARLTINAIAAEDVPEFGRGVYLLIEGYFGADLVKPIARAAENKDGDICIFLNEPAKANLLEQLETHRTIVSLHDAMAKQAKG
jgi:hypothetical protein